MQPVHTTTPGSNQYLNDPWEQPVFTTTPGSNQYLQRPLGATSNYNDPWEQPVLTTTPVSNQYISATSTFKTTTVNESYTHILNLAHTSDGQIRLIAFRGVNRCLPGIRLVRSISFPFPRFGAIHRNVIQKPRTRRTENSIFTTLKRLKTNKTKTLKTLKMLKKTRKTFKPIVFRGEDRLRQLWLRQLWLC